MLYDLATNSNNILQSTTEQKDLGVWTTSTMNLLCTVTKQPARQIRPWA